MKKDWVICKEELQICKLHWVAYSYTITWVCTQQCYTNTSKTHSRSWVPLRIKEGQKLRELSGQPWPVPGGGVVFKSKAFGLTHSNIQMVKATMCMHITRMNIQDRMSKGSGTCQRSWVEDQRSKQGTILAIISVLSSPVTHLLLGRSSQEGQVCYGNYITWPNLST